MTILVTGGAGYIGSHMILKLLDNKEDFLCLDNYSTGSWRLAADDRFVEADLLSFESIENSLQKKNITTIIHFASKSLVEESSKDPSMYFHNNLVTSLNLMRYAVLNDVKTFIFSSTAAVYGQPETKFIDELTPANPINPYGRSKLFIEEILQDSLIPEDINLVIFRYFNVAGADPLSRSGESHDPETHLIPIILKNSFKKDFCINIFGSDYDTPDGTCIRDYVHVSDIADAHYVAVEWSRNNPGGHIFNLGSGSGYSVNEVVSACQDVTSKRASIFYLDKRPGDPNILVADSTKATEQLKWKRKYNLHEMIADAYRWHEKKSTEN